MSMVKIFFSGVPQKATLLEHDHRNDFTGEEILLLLSYMIYKWMSVKYNKVSLDKNQNTGESESGHQIGKKD